MSAPVYERGVALDRMLVRPRDRQTRGPTGITKARRYIRPGAKPQPLRGPTYAPMSNPAMRPLQVEGASLMPASKPGMRKGHRHHEQLAAREAATAEAQELVAAVADKLNIEDSRAQSALEFAVSVVKDDTVGVKERLSAARLTLDFTQPKPASRQELEIKKAEDFLDALAKDDDPEAA